MSLFSSTGAYSPGFALILVGLIVVAVWKVPGFPRTPSLQRVGGALAAHFSLAGISAWMLTWDRIEKVGLGFLAMFQLFTLGLAIFFFVAAFTSANRNP
ncbi:MAG: hypothetical protein V4726_15485 [Verrucomicrobiota bacterium]